MLMTFEVEVLIGSEVLGVGEGRSKRVAERAAALAALTTPREAEQEQATETDGPSPAPISAGEKSPAPSEEPGSPESGQG